MSRLKEIIREELINEKVFGSQAQYDAYQENPRKYEKYLMRGGGWEI